MINTCILCDPNQHSDVSQWLNQAPLLGSKAANQVKVALTGPKPLSKGLEIALSGKGLTGTWGSVNSICGTLLLDWNQRDSDPKRHTAQAMHYLRQVFQS